jgi:phosphoribosylformylglycinamidine cyclo-ligase
MKRSEVIDNANIEVGDVIVGLASFGQAKYESEYNGGMGSNGLTSARHDVFDKYLKTKYPERSPLPPHPPCPAGLTRALLTLNYVFSLSFDPAVPTELVYSGSKRLTDKIAVSEDGKTQVTVGKLVLSPTRTYAPIISKLLAKHRSEIHGMIHCSGGAQTKILHFAGDGLHIVKVHEMLNFLFFPSPNTNVTFRTISFLYRRCSN